MSFFKKIFSGVKEFNSNLQEIEKAQDQIEAKQKAEDEPYGFELAQQEENKVREAARKEAFRTTGWQRHGYSHKHRVIGLIVDPFTEEHVGYRVLSEDTLLKQDVLISEFVASMRNSGLVHGELANRGFEKSYSKEENKISINIPLRFKPTDGTNVKKYPVIRADNLQVVKNDVVIVRARVVDDTTKELSGFLVTDGNATLQFVSVPQLVEYRSVGYLNVKLSNKDGKPVFQALKGNIPDVPLSDVVKNIHGIETAWC